MAFVGLKYCVFAPITTETPFTPIVYGTGVVLGRMIGANITFNRNSEPLYADDGMAESDNSITGGTISLNLDDVEEAAQVTAFGLLKTGDPGSEVYSEVGDPAPYGGIGYVRVRRLRGVTSYVAYWLHKVQLNGLYRHHQIIPALVFLSSISKRIITIILMEQYVKLFI